MLITWFLDASVHSRIICEIYAVKPISCITNKIMEGKDNE